MVIFLLSWETVDDFSVMLAVALVASVFSGVGLQPRGSVLRNQVK